MEMGSSFPIRLGSHTASLTGSLHPGRRAQPVGDLLRAVLQNVVCPPLLNHVPPVEQVRLGLYFWALESGWFLSTGRPVPERGEILAPELPARLSGSVGLACRRPWDAMWGRLGSLLPTLN